MTDESRRPSTADRIGQATGGITGILAGAAVGTAAGPLGVLLGGIAGAIGGWWTGRAIVEAAEDISEADERYYRDHFQRTGHSGGYELARSAYLLGDIAAANPEYAGRRFEDVEPELERGWSKSVDARDWAEMRDYALVGFTRGRDRRRTPRDTGDRRARQADASNDTPDPPLG